MENYTGGTEEKFWPLTRREYNEYTGQGAAKIKVGEVVGYFIMHPASYDRWSQGKRFDGNLSGAEKPDFLKLGSSISAKIMHCSEYAFDGYHHYIIEAGGELVSNIQFQKREANSGKDKDIYLVNIVIHSLIDFFNLWNFKNNRRQQQQQIRGI